MASDDSSPPPAARRSISSDLVGIAGILLTAGFLLALATSL